MFRKPNTDIRMIQEMRQIKLCKNCKYFARINETSELKYGNCTLFGSINVIDGSIEYTPASIAREYYCNEKYYEDNMLK